MIQKPFVEHLSTACKESIVVSHMENINIKKKKKTCFESLPELKI